MDVRETKAKHAVVPKAPTTPARYSHAVALAYGRFLELPVPAVLAVLWLLGALLLGAAVAAAYLAGVGLLAATAIL